MTREQMELIPTDGITTCLWHRAHELYMANVVPTLPNCTICGGKVDPRITAHYLCVEYKKRGMATPQLNTINQCPCTPCRKARKEI
jgi:hypothetical protein